MQDNGEGLSPSKKDTQLIQPGSKFYYTSTDGVTVKEAVFSAYEVVNGNLSVRCMSDLPGQHVAVVTRPLEEFTKQNPRDGKGKEMFFSFKVRRSSGEVEDDWRFGWVTPAEDKGDPEVHVTKLEITGAGTPTGKVFTKDVPMSSIIALNVESKGKN